MKGKESSYDYYCLYDLRKIAKEKGVPNPTTYRKKELIKQILQIDDGIIKPRFSNKGRPTTKKINLTLSSNDVIIVLDTINKIRKLLEALEKEIIK